MKPLHRITAVALCASAALASAQARAQTGDGWQFGASIYGWFPSVSGRTTFEPPAGGSSDIHIDISQILENLDFVFMGSFEARRGRWGGFADFIYLDLSASKSQVRGFEVGGRPLPGGVTADATLLLKTTVWTFAGEYRALADPGVELDTFVGARRVDIDQTLRYDVSGNLGPIPLPDRSGSRGAQLANWDAIVGVKGRFAFGADRRWFVPFYVDVGAGDSDRTYQAMTGLGYRFGWGEMVGQWRYLDYDFGDKVDKLAFGGAALAFNFRW